MAKQAYASEEDRAGTGDAGAVVARLLAFDARHGRRLATFALVFMVPLLLTYWLVTLSRSGFTGPPQVPIDFLVFWSAAKLSLAGMGAQAFDLAVLKSIEGMAAAPDTLLWFYPPGVMALVTPLGLLPYAPAMIVFGLLSLAAWCAAIRPWLPAARGLRLAFMLAPAMMPALLLGHLTLLLAATMLAGLTALERNRPVLAGLFFGLLTLKPQLGLMLPVALLARGHWKTVAVAAVTALLLAGLPTLLYGMAYWSAFARSSSGLIDLLDTYFHEQRGMLGAYTALRLAGIGHEAAIGSQFLLALATAALVWAAWRAPGATADSRAAVVLAAIPFGTPYLWSYELPFLTLAGLALLRAGALATGPGALLVVLLWIGSLPFSIAISLEFGKSIPQGPFLMPLVLITFCVALRAALVPPSQSAEETQT